MMICPPDSAASVRRLCCKYSIYPSFKGGGVLARSTARVAGVVCVLQRARWGQGKLCWACCANQKAPLFCRSSSGGWLSIWDAETRPEQAIEHAILQSEGARRLKDVYNRPPKIPTLTCPLYLLAWLRGPFTRMKSVRLLIGGKQGDAGRTEMWPVLVSTRL
jgi:hypothetical protein